MAAIRRMVALGDILGFSATVLKSDADRVVRGPIGFLRNALEHSMNRAGWPVKEPTLQELQSNPIMGFAWFSDTILLYGRDDSDRAAKAVIETSAWLIHEAMHAPRSQMRFAIDHDEMYADERDGVFVGKALVHTAELEKAQEWSGGALTNAAVARARDLDVSEFTVEYDIPFKPGSHTETMAINWAFAPHENQPHLPPAWSPSSDAPTAADIGNCGSIATKWLNTKAFHDYACIAHGRRGVT